MGVPGLDLGIPQAAEQSAPSKKRPHPSEEDIISLEDEIDLYSFGPSPASLAAASEGLAHQSCADSSIQTEHAFQSDHCSQHFAAIHERMSSVFL